MANLLARTPEQAAFALAHGPDGLAEPLDAIRQARAEIDTLSRLLHG
jgi:hypothetical protein